MKEICFAEYAKCLQKAIQEPNSNEEVVHLLLDWIIEKYNISNKNDDRYDLEKSTISGLINRKIEIPKAIQNVCSTKEIGVEAQKYCNEKIIPCLNEFLKDDMLEEMAICIENSQNVSKTMRKTLINSFESKKYDEFLGLFLIYAINQKNKIVDLQPEVDDIPLLEEVEFICPLCHSQLIKNVNGKTIKKYKVVRLCPKQYETESKIMVEKGIIKNARRENSNENKIPLCKNCAEDYEEAPTLKMFEQLCDLKDRLSEANLARINMDKIEIEDEIRNIIKGLSKINQETELKELSFSALRLDQKILPENFLLKKVETNRVVYFYHYINKLFSEMDQNNKGSFDLIASEISNAYEHLNSSQLSQSEIVEHLAQWIKKKSRCGDKELDACHIVVAYFIQNCEVFHEISK